MFDQLVAGWKVAGMVAERRPLTSAKNPAWRGWVLKVASLGHTFELTVTERDYESVMEGQIVSVSGHFDEVQGRLETDRGQGAAGATGEVGVARCERSSGLLGAILERSCEVDSWRRSAQVRWITVLTIRYVRIGKTVTWIGRGCMYAWMTELFSALISWRLGSVCRGRTCVTWCCGSRWRTAAVGWPARFGNESRGR